MSNERIKNLLRHRATWAACLLLFGGGIVYATWNGRDQSSPLANAPTFAVQQGSLTISVSQSGTIQPRERVAIRSELEGRNSIIYLVPEGAHVQKGDLLIELDSSSLQEQLLERQIQTQNAEAAYLTSRENFQVVKNQATADIAQAELDVQFARQDLNKFIEGEYPNREREAEARIALAEETLKQAEETLAWSQRLAEEGYLSQSEFQRDELAKQRAKLDLELAQRALELLKTYTYDRELTQLKSDLEQAEMALERTRGRAQANIIQAEADLNAKRSEHQQQLTRLDRLEDQIDKATIHAPIDGQVVYATSMRTSWRGNAEPLEVGHEVRQREELIFLPTTSAYMAEVKVHESNLEKISVGLPVRISVDAIPGRTFYGRVHHIAPLPDAASMFMNPDLKVYNTEIHVEGDPDLLRSGMSCRAEIIVDHYDDAIYVPVQAVVRVDGQPTVYVADGREFQPQPVELGLNNNRLARILDGLQPGQLVSLTPPLSESRGGVRSETPSDELADRIRESRSHRETLDGTGVGQATGVAEEPEGRPALVQAPENETVADETSLQRDLPEQPRLKPSQPADSLLQ